MSQNLKPNSQQDLALHEDELRHLRVQDMKSSRPEDVQEILDGIPNHDAFNEQLHHMMFDEKSGLLSAWWCSQQRMEQAGRLASLRFAVGTASLRALL